MELLTELSRSPSPLPHGRGDGEEAMVERVVHLGFEVRVELVRDDGEHLFAQLTSDEAEQLELERGRIVYVRTNRARTFSVAP